MFGRHGSRRFRGPSSPARSVRSPASRIRATPEVEEFHHVLFGDEDIGWPEIAVNDALAVEARRASRGLLALRSSGPDWRKSPVLPLPESRWSVSPSSSSMTRNGFVVLGHVVVLDRARGPGDRRGPRRSLRAEIAPGSGIPRELGVEDLEGGARAVPVRRRVDVSASRRSPRRASRRRPVLDGQTDPRAGLVLFVARVAGQRRRGRASGRRVRRRA